MHPRIIRHRLGRWVDPAHAFAALHADNARAFWLDGGIHADLGMSFMGSSSRVATASAVDETVTLWPSGEVLEVPVLEFIRSRVEAAARPGGPELDGGLDREGGAHLDGDTGRGVGSARDDSADLDGEPGRDGGGARDGDPVFPGGQGCPIGWVGWLGYEVRVQTAPVTRAGGVRAGRHPDSALMFVDRLVAFDHASRTVELLAVGESWAGDLEQWRDATVAALNAPAPQGPALEHAPPSTPCWRDTDEAYLAKIAECQAAIRNGEAYQLCLTTEVTVDARPDPLATWLALRTTSPSHHGGFLRVGDVTLLSASPEQFLSVASDGTVESRPIKGTRPRGSSLADDARLRAELESSDKELAENLMIVDLVRNDLGRVCDPGSVRVPELFAVESYAHVHQLVSTVRGTLARGRHQVDAVAACFPAGSMTGAPKIRATEILDGLEARARGIYSGAFGYFGLDGSVDLAMVIRSIVLDGAGATIGTGGGITALSVPADELAEVKLKAAALLAVLGA